MLKRTGWTNEEVISFIEGNRISLDESVSDEDRDWITEHNSIIEKCTVQFYDFMADPEKSYSAMAYDTEDKQVYVISDKRLPQ